METNIDIIMKYKGTAVWYAYQIIDECSLRDDLMTAAARGTYTQAEQDEIRGIAVRFCKTCNMVSFASDVAMCAMLNWVTKVDDGSAICADTLEKIAKCYLEHDLYAFFDGDDLLAFKE